MVSDLLDLLRVEVPRELESRVPLADAQRNGRGRCVQATRVGIEALRYFGVEATPLVTLMMVGNEEWVQWMLAGKPQPLPEEVWSVGIDPEPRLGDRGYPAHLVIEIDGQILDLDAGMYARPHKGIFLPPTVLVPIRRQQGAQLPIAALDLEGGGAILYHDRGAVRVAPPDYRGTSAWKVPVSWAGPVIRRMREQLATTARSSALPEDRGSRVAS